MPHITIVVIVDTYIANLPYTTEVVIKNSHILDLNNGTKIIVLNKMIVLISRIKTHTPLTIKTNIYIDLVSAKYATSTIQNVKIKLTIGKHCKFNSTFIKYESITVVAHTKWRTCKTKNRINCYA